MLFGAIFPQTEFGHDPIAVRDYAQTAESLGFSHILAFDHVLGANPERPGGWTGPYTYRNSFLDPFVLFSFMAAMTQKIEFTTGILILPQRQTALVAKQAATLDVLSSGRLRLGVGLGWNRVEYISLNEEFHTRGRRVEEQVELLRQLWTQPLVNFTGRWHNIPDAGINPMPIQRPIPIWFGGSAENVLRRIAKIGDGWLTTRKNAQDAGPSLYILDRFLEEYGRSRSDIGLEPRLSFGKGEPAIWQTIIQDWQAVGATHISLNTMDCGLNTPADHINALHTFAVEVGLE